MGFYTISSHGWIISHSNSEDSKPQADLKFKDGDIVTVEFDPSSRGVSFRVEGNRRKMEMATSIDPSTIPQARFCVSMTWQGESASIKQE